MVKEGKVPQVVRLEERQYVLAAASEYLLQRCDLLVKQLKTSKVLCLR